MKHLSIDAAGTRIHAVEAGEGPLVLLVHGFPESWYSWRHQLPALADAGYRAVAIDVRGYGRSSKPQAVEDYRMVRHVADNVEVSGSSGTFGGGPEVEISEVTETTLSGRLDFEDRRLASLLRVPPQPRSPHRRHPFSGTHRAGQHHSRQWS